MLEKYVRKFDEAIKWKTVKGKKEAYSDKKGFSVKKEGEKYVEIEESDCDLPSDKKKKKKESKGLGNLNALSKFKEADVKKVIDEVIDTNWGGSNDEQMKAVQLLKGIATSDEAMSNKFMKALDKATSAMKKDDFK